MKLTHKIAPPPYDAQRRAEYPPIVDFADALYWHSRGIKEPLVAYFEAIARVKAKYPKSATPAQ